MLRVIFALFLSSVISLASANEELLQQQLYKLSNLSTPEKDQDSYIATLKNLSQNPNIDTHSEALVKILMAEYYIQNSDATQARELLNIAKPLMSTVDSTELNNNYQFVNMFVLRDEGHLEQALALNAPLLESVQEHWAKGKICEIVLEGAYINSLLANYDKSIELLELGLNYAAQTNDPYQFAQTYNLFGIVYSDLNDNQSALRYFLKAINLQVIHPEFVDLLYTYGNLADTYRELEQYDKAIETANKFLELSIESNEPSSVSFSHQILSRIYVDQEKYEKALTHLFITQKLAEEAGEELFNFEIYTEFANIYIKTKQYDKATEALQKAEHYSRKAGSTEEFYLHRLKSNLYVEQEQYKEAYEEIKTSYKQYRAQFNENLTQVSNLARENLDQEKLSFENKLLEQENQLKTQHLADSSYMGLVQTILIIILSIVVAVLVWGILRYKNLASDNQRLALTDNLTQLPNRRSVFRTLDSKHRESVNGTEHYSIILFDIDHFKSVNDRFGHAIGDATIQATSDICHAVLREPDTIGRIGGEEFLIILPNTELSDAYSIAERLRISFEQYDFDKIATGLKVTSSFGVTQYLPEDESLDIVINRADRLLYKAKNDGRNLVYADRE